MEAGTSILRFSIAVNHYQPIGLGFNRRGAAKAAPSRPGAIVMLAKISVEPFAAPRV
jgi:hypothetical protein